MRQGPKAPAADGSKGRAGFCVCMGWAQQKHQVCLLQCLDERPWAAAAAVHS